MKMFTIIALLISALPVFSYEAENVNIKREGEIVLYQFVGLYPFLDFIENPSEAILSKSNHALYRFRRSAEYEGRLISEFDGEQRVHDLNGPLPRVQNLMIHPELIDFFGYTDAVQRYLLANGITANVKNRVLIGFFISGGSGLNYVLWVETDIGDYFITVRHSHFIAEPEYDFVLYSWEEFYESYKLRDGRLMINGEDVTEGLWLKFQNRTLYISFGDLMEALGSNNIEWDIDERIVWFEYNGVDYIFTDNRRFALLYGEEPIPNLIYFRGLVGGYGTTFMIHDDIIIMDRIILDFIFRELGINRNINFDERILYINMD